MPDFPRTQLAAQLDDYFLRWPEEKPANAGFSALLSDPDPFVRTRLEGHFTGSAWLVSADGRRTLLTHHRKLGRWLQPGGHADGDADLAQVALKEALEESGITGLRVEAAAIFDLDRHWIPARAEVPGHWHFDVRYVVQAVDSEDYVVGAESHDLAWRTIVEVARDADQALRRMARKWLMRGGQARTPGTTWAL